jgi:hypothetical protein
MKFNLNGTISASSVQNIKRVVLHSKEGERVKDVLVKAKNHGKVKIGQIAVLGDKEWIRVRPDKFNGSPWIEIQ